MRIILSPAKKMNVDTDQMACTGLPAFMDRTEEIMHWMQALSYEEAKKLWACNDKIAEENFQRFRDMDLTRQLTPAILSYEGIAYQYMAPSVFENGEYSKCIEKYLTPEDTYITCVFGELETDKKTGKQKVVQKGVYAKMARGLDTAFQRSCPMRRTIFLLSCNVDIKKDIVNSKRIIIETIIRGLSKKRSRILIKS